MIKFLLLIPHSLVGQKSFLQSACEFNYINKLKINKYQKLSSKFQHLLVLDGASVQMEIGHFGIPVGSNSVGVPE
jgi:hypothetical protein